MKTFNIKVKGIVQGVGFRPFIFRLAGTHGLKGFVTNSSSGVEIEVNGEKQQIEDFASDIQTKCPPLAHIIEVTIECIPFREFEMFSIEPSKITSGITLVPPDTALCDECAKEMDDPADRRYNYPFTNCTNCGPRYSIIKKMPYDRPDTTMSKFRMCPSCQKEYDDPADRRFHAQPNACPVCGPMVYLGKNAGQDAIDHAAEIIDSGGIIAVKGLGGYHLICDATQDIPVKTLRNLKKRPDKPLAVMCSYETIQKYCDDAPSLKLFCSPQAPIVIMKVPDLPVSAFANPMSPNVGCIAPYTPLHRVLMKTCKSDFLIATSGNRKDEPIAKDEREAEKALSEFTSHFLHHTRPIHNRVDDSLVSVVDGMPYVMRRARGFAPYPVMLPSAVNGCVLALGAHLKNTITIAKDNYAFVSQYIGDLDNPDTCEFFEETIDKMKMLYGLEPDSVVCDMHPNYHSTGFAESLGLPVQRVQHHISHMMACMAENGLKDNVLGVVLDGTGLGTDGTIWGGEFLLMKNRKISRPQHLPKVMQPGMDGGAKNPGRMLISYLHHFGILERYMETLTKKLFIPEKDIKLTVSMIEKNINCIPTTSAGRLFESLGAAVTGVTKNLFEAHSAMKMEGLAHSADRKYHKVTDTDSDDFYRNVFEYTLNSVQANENPQIIAADIHSNFVKHIIFCIKNICNIEEVGDVVLSGGVFQNLFLTKELTKVSRLNIHRHKAVPPNDSCISLGQAYYKTYSKIRNFGS
ncbi:(NiFe) hydrogenase maturation protein HypF [Denitrovibrio acetiphilus DSM 12809]|uniref:Carbamoyltransferase n=2 Tax=Denitrovibrio TaxID=117999 RepID=D4H730_DENA2|nr:(NiFe) hydrogenase maturation protein HypF [Denitrovibrio acetiphilus DSM 12809]